MTATPTADTAGRARRTRIIRIAQVGFSVAIVVAIFAYAICDRRRPFGRETCVRLSRFPADRADRTSTERGDSHALGTAQRDHPRHGPVGCSKAERWLVAKQRYA